MAKLPTDAWNYIPEEVLVHIFSYLPLRDRHTIFCVCSHWAEVASASSVWSFTEICCNIEDVSADTVLRSLHHFLPHIKHLRIVFDQSLEINRRRVSEILDVLAWQSRKLCALSVVCTGRSPYFYSGQDILLRIRRLCQGTGNIDLQYIDFRRTPFTLDNGIVQLMATNHPNLRALFINVRTPGIIILKPDTIVEVLRACPKISTLGIYHCTLTEDVFLELLKPGREPFRCLDIFCEGLDNEVPEELWSALSQKHPQLRVELEFAPLVPAWKVPWILKPNIPVTALQFNTFGHLSDQIQFVTTNYSKTLQKLVLHTTTPSSDLNSSLIDLASKCVHLKEIHCHCTVSQAVVNAFLLHCTGLRRYTLTTCMYL
ncbi:F-box/LRR-repeat protein 8-like [Tiliqua scincoides]|uniref:F-box/LRR-repeat protein 8-like n=1 Tax=Tiliqua scincoides TaxID=71010 RepID=UPI00346368AD